MALASGAISQSATRQRSFVNDPTDKLGTRLNKLAASMAPLNPPRTTTTLCVRFINRLVPRAPEALCAQDHRRPAVHIAYLMNRHYTH
jgi:hypothetical protein